MLTLHKIAGGRGGAYATYLTSIEATGDYYVGPDGDPWAAPGEWLGGLAPIGDRRVDRRDQRTLRVVFADVHQERFEPRLVHPSTSRAAPRL